MAKGTIKNNFTEKKIKRNKELRIGRVSDMMHEHVKNVADHVGVSMTDFMKVTTLHFLTTVPKNYLEPFKKD